MLHLLRKKIRMIGVITSLLCVLLMQSGEAMAQVFNRYEMNQYDHDSKPYYFGITVGVNLARFQTDLHPRFLQDDSIYVAEPNNSGGLTLGLSATARLSNRFQLRFNPQLMFIERNIYFKLKNPTDIDHKFELTQKVESVIMAFPLNIKFQSDRIGNFRVYMMAGVTGNIDMASNARAKKADNYIKIAKYDWGPELGIGCNFFFESFILSPEIKISNGMRNIHARDPKLIYSSVFDKIQSRMIIFSLHIEG